MFGANRQVRASQALWLLLPACAATVDIAVQLEWAYADTNDSRKLFWATVALCALPVVVLARRRWPIATFLTTLPGMYLDSCIPSMIALYTVALMATRRRVVTVCTVVFLLWSGYTLNPEEATWDNPTDYFILMDAVAQAILPVTLGLLVSSRAELTARVADLAAARSREDALSAERLLVAERTRLAREMHDVVAHQVSLISVEAAALQMTTSDPAVRDSACAVRTMAARTLDELRQVVGVLRDGGNRADTGAPQPRLAGLPQLIRECQLEVEARIDPRLLQPATGSPSRWPTLVQHAVYRTVQEALTNIRKHAPGAVVSVRLHESDGHLCLRIHNGPPGLTDPHPDPDLPSGGYGLIGLAERAHLVGGTFEARPTDDGGHLVTASFPTRHAAEATSP